MIKLFFKLNYNHDFVVAIMPNGNQNVNKKSKQTCYVGYQYRLSSKPIVFIGDTVVVRESISVYYWSNNELIQFITYHTHHKKQRTVR